MYICYVQTGDLDHPRIVLHKPWIRALRTNPRIAHTCVYVHMCTFYPIGHSV